MTKLAIFSLFTSLVVQCILGADISRIKNGTKIIGKDLVGMTDGSGKPIWAKCEKTIECSFPMICADLYGDGLECAYNPCTDDNSCAEGKTCDFENLCDAQPCVNDDNCPEYYECKEKASWYDQPGCWPGNCVFCDFDKEVCKNDKCEPKPKVPLAAIIGGSVGLVVLISIGVAIFLFMRNKKRKEGTKAKNIENQEKVDEFYD